MKDIIMRCAIIAAVVAMFAIAGSTERCEQTIYTMGDETYREIRVDLERENGVEPTDREIAREYLSRQDNEKNE